MTARILPIFPLPLVLFPGVTLPLHIFEPRYRRMLADCLAGDRSFGIIYLPSGTDELSLAAGGEVGCIAHIDSARSLPDGRSNITVAGAGRFMLQRFVPSPSPYHVGEVIDLDDVPEPAGPLETLAARVRETFDRVARAARTITDESPAAPDLPSDPALLAYHVAYAIDLGAADRQRLLVSRSAGERLRTVDSLLTAAVDPLERRARVHVLAKANGNGPAAHA